MTHTYAELFVSPAVYAEIHGKLVAVGYDHAFMDDGAIDMHGIGLKAAGPAVVALTREEVVALVETTAHESFGHDSHGRAMVALLRRLDRWLTETK